MEKEEQALQRYDTATLPLGRNWRLFARLIMRRDCFQDAGTIGSGNSKAEWCGFAKQSRHLGVDLVDHGSHALVIFKTRLGLAKRITLIQDCPRWQPRGRPNHSPKQFRTE